MPEFNGNVALVTGTTGIGRACAWRLAEDGAKVLACVIDAKAKSSTPPPCPASARAYSGEGVSVEPSFQRFGAAHPVGRIGEPEEVAELAAFLASGKAGFCTGSDHRIDSGLTASLGVK